MSKTFLDGSNLSERYDALLAPYAQHNTTSLGRKHPEIADPGRLPFQRDRDRVIHTKAFRRLRGKMQVVSPRKGDHFRTRLSHTIEVAQTSRDLARTLRLNEDLSEAIALAHDLGHPPFGHAGESELHAQMSAHGREFDHNAQSLRVVEFFEQRYPDFDGLNLSHEVLEGMQKHETFFDRPSGDSIFSPHLESQLVDIADEIAYLSADLEDGLRAELYSIHELSHLEIVATAQKHLPADRQDHRSSLIRRIIRDLLTQLVSDTGENIERLSIQSLKDVQQASEKIVVFAPGYFEQVKALKNFLHTRYYQAPEVLAETEHGKTVVRELFTYLYDHPEKLPPAKADEDMLARIADYIAGMTDDFAMEKWKQGG